MSIIKNAVENFGTFYTSDSFIELKSLQLDLKSELGANIVPNEPTPIYSSGINKYQLFTLEREENKPEAPIGDFTLSRVTHNQYFMELLVDVDWLKEQEANPNSSDLYNAMGECEMSFSIDLDNVQVEFSTCKSAVKQVIHTLYDFKLIHPDIYEMMLHELETLAEQPINITCANYSLSTPRKLYLFNAEFPFKELLERVQTTLGLTEPMKEFTSETFFEYGLRLNIAELEYVQRFLLNSYLTLNINL